MFTHNYWRFNLNDKFSLCFLSKTLGHCKLTAFLTEVSFLLAFSSSNLGFLLILKMSLESKFEKLSIGDESFIVDAIRKDGVDKSAFANNIDVLVAKCGSTDDSEALAAMATSKALAEVCPEAEAFNIDCLTACKMVLVNACGNLLIAGESMHPQTLLFAKNADLIMMLLVSAYRLRTSDFQEPRSPQGRRGHCFGHLLKHHPVCNEVSASSDFC